MRAHLNPQVTRRGLSRHFPVTGTLASYSGRVRYMNPLYAPGNGVAIQTTVRQLCSSLRRWNDTNIHMVPVEYFGPDEQEEYTDQAFYGSLFIKHGRYRKEKELRALAYRVNPGTGVEIPVEVDVLIERLLLSPELPDWAVRFVTEAIRHFGFVGQIDLR